MGATEIVAFLSHSALQRNVAASIQNLKVLDGSAQLSYPESR